MAQGFVTGTVAGVALQVGGVDNCMITLLNAGAFQLNMMGSNSRGTEGAIFSEVFTAPALAFGLHFHYAYKPLVDSIIAAINTALATPATFPVDVQDGFIEIAYNCTWNFDNAPEGATYPEQRTSGEPGEQYVKDFIMWFYAVSAIG